MRLDRDRGGDDLREQPLPALLQRLVRDGQGLLRDEVRLARAELRHEVQKAKKGGAALGAAGAVGWAAILLLGAALILVGDLFLPAWAAALVVTAIYGLVAAALLQLGKKELARVEPSRAVENLKEDGRWAKETMRDIGSSRSANA